MSAVAPQAPATAMVQRRPQRLDAWWVKPVITAAVLGAFVVYATWAALQNANYYAAPYLSPFYSPCLAPNCAHVRRCRSSAPGGICRRPSWCCGSRCGFRATCYYYRKAYYRSFFWSPPACAVPDARPRYSRRDALPASAPEHPPLFLLPGGAPGAVPVVGCAAGVPLPDGFGIGLGTLILVANVALLSLYTLLVSFVPALCGGVSRLVLGRRRTGYRACEAETAHGRRWNAVVIADPSPPGLQPVR